MNPPKKSSRRKFIGQAAGAGAAVGASSLLGPFAGAAIAGGSRPRATGTRFDLRALGMPYRQDDPRWSRDLMWNREKVIKTAMLDGYTRKQASSLIRRFPNGNTIGNEGCQLTCMAMVLRMLAPNRRPVWTPPRLNAQAHASLYYTKSGLSLVPLYADLVEEVTWGRVQLGIKEEYLPGVSAWERAYCDSAPLVRAYRSMPPESRTDFLVMLKTGTYDDTVASHYVLLDPNSTQSPDDRDAEILDPAMPMRRSGRWTLTDSADWITTDPAIRREWRRQGIQKTQIGGAWVFNRWEPGSARSLLTPLVEAWANEI